jgi:hypothetical protein
MGLFTRKTKFEIAPADARGRDYALREMQAPDLAAECFGEYIAAERAVGASLGADLSAEWWAWCALNVAICPKCDNSWVLLVSCVSAWECQDCPHIWNGE